MRTAPPWNSLIGCSAAAQLKGCPRARQPWGQTPLQLGRSAPLRDSLLCFALARHLHWFSCSQGYSLQSPMVCALPEPEGRGLYEQKTLPSIPDWPILMQRRTPKSHSLVQKALLWLVRIEPLWLVRVAQVQLDGESLNLIGRNRIPGNLYEGWFRWEKHRAGRQFNAKADSSAQKLLHVG